MSGRVWRDLLLQLRQRGIDVGASLRRILQADGRGRAGEAQISTTQQQGEEQEEEEKEEIRRTASRGFQQKFRLRARQATSDCGSRV